MHRERPLVTERPDELKALLNHEPQRQKRQRRHALSLFATDQATTRQAVAHLLGLHRVSIVARECITTVGHSGSPALSIPLANSPSERCGTVCS